MSLRQKIECVPKLRTATTSGFAQLQEPSVLLAAYSSHE